jgi:hypothetical protein
MVHWVTEFDLRKYQLSYIKADRVPKRILNEPIHKFEIGLTTVSSILPPIIIVQAWYSVAERACISIENNLVTERLAHMSPHTAAALRHYCIRLMVRILPKIIGKR